VQKSSGTRWRHEKVFTVCFGGLSAGAIRTRLLPHAYPAVAVCFLVVGRSCRSSHRSVMYTVYCHYTLV